MHVFSLSCQTGYCNVLKGDHSRTESKQNSWGDVSIPFSYGHFTWEPLKTFSKSDGERKVKKQLWLLTVLWELFLSREIQSMQLEDISGQTLAYIKGSLFLWPSKGCQTPVNSCTTTLRLIYVSSAVILLRLQWCNKSAQSGHSIRKYCSISESQQVKWLCESLTLCCHEGSNLANATSGWQLILFSFKIPIVSDTEQSFCLRQ